jgi:hypothetical protein
MAMNDEVRRFVEEMAAYTHTFHRGSCRENVTGVRTRSVSGAGLRARAPFSSPRVPRRGPADQECGTRHTDGAG